jgi:hypothetical protein
MNHQKQRMLHDATWDGRMDILLELVCDPEVDVSGQHSCALLHAAHRGRLDAVRLLLPLSDPLAHRSEALLRAGMHGHQRCVRLPLPVSDTSKWYPHEWESLRAPARRMIEAHVRMLGATPPVSAHAAVVHQSFARPK